MIPPVMVRTVINTVNSRLGQEYQESAGMSINPGKSPMVRAVINGVIPVPRCDSGCRKGTFPAQKLPEGRESGGI